MHPASLMVTPFVMNCFLKVLHATKIDIKQIFYFIPFHSYFIHECKQEIYENIVFHDSCMYKRCGMAIAAAELFQYQTKKNRVRV